MPGPLAAVLIGAAAQGGAAIVGNVFGQAVASVTNPIMMYSKYEANQIAQSGMPELSWCVQAYLGNRINEDALGFAFNVANLPLFGKKDNQFQKFSGEVINQYIESLLPKMSLEQLLYCYYSGIITKDDWNKLASKFRVKGDNLRPLMDVTYAKFDLGIIINNYNRGSWDKNETISRIRKFTGCYEEHAVDILDNSRFLPPPGDLLRFAVRDVYDKDAIARLGLDQEYDLIKDIIPWAKAQGIGEATIHDGHDKPITRDILKDYWLAHWQLMSPTQGYEALHMLRPSRMGRYASIVPDLKPFDFGELNYLLKANDYVPEQRKWLAAISYGHFQKRDLRNIYNEDLISDDELKEQLLDTGLIPDDANVLAQWYKETKDKKKKDDKLKEAKQKYGKVYSELLKAYEIGSISRAEAIERGIYYIPDEELVTGDINAIDIRINSTRVKYFVKMVKDEFFLGLYTPQEAYVQLVAGGLTDLRSNQYVILWQRQLSRPRRLASVNTVVDWLKRGIIGFDDARSRLNNLGLSNADTLLYLESANMDIQKAIQVENNKRAKSDKQKAQEAERLMRQARQQKKTLITELKSYSGIAQMGKWLLLGEITLLEVIERMRFMEVPEADIDRYLTEWGFDRNGQLNRIPPS